MLLKAYLLYHRIGKYKALLPLLLAGVLYISLGFFFLEEYIIFGLNTFFGLIIAPYLFIMRGTERSERYFWLSLLCIVLSIVAPLKTLYFLSLLFALLFLLESFIGKVNVTVPLLLILVSPIFLYFSSFFGVPLRIELSEIASKLLSFAGYETKALGNIIILNGKEFSVDSGCMGLSMLGVSFILSLFLIAYYERKTSKKLSIPSLFLLLSLAVILNLCSNLFRIVVLVLFNIAPENPMHEVAGLVCFTIYIAFPMVALTRFFYKIMAKRNEFKSNEKIYYSRTLIFHFILLGMLLFSGMKLKDRKYFKSSIPECRIAGYDKSVINSEVLKFENSKALIYVKPVQSFYGAEHSPMICWTNNGYDFTKVNTHCIYGTEVYMGILKKNNEKIYCSWWFDNGKEKTIGQADWRWEVLTGGKNFCLVNVNTSTEEILLKETTELLQQNIFEDE